MAGQKHSKPTVAVIFAREDTSGFNRCSFPILGRSVVSYPIMAALVSKKIDKVYLSTQSERILQTVKAFDNICVIHRENECDTLVEEFQRSALKVIDELGEEPAQIVLLLGNSPCILSKTIDNALEVLEAKPKLDSVVTVVKRREFSPVYAFRITNGGLLTPFPFGGTESSYEYFEIGRAHV